MTAHLRRLARLAVLLLIPVALAGCGINTIPTKQEKARAAWADVQNQYQRRADLVPNLVATVKGYAGQESRVLIAVTQARANALQVRSGAEVTTDPSAFQRYATAQNNLSLALAPLRVLQEAYPDLKSNQNFLVLQSQLEGTENRISVARRDYNEAVRDYNTSLRTFPTIIWAKTAYASSEPMLLFRAPGTSQSAPTVDFTPTAAPDATPVAPTQ